jgi:hypothetical protein
MRRKSSLGSRPRGLALVTVMALLCGLLSLVGCGTRSAAGSPSSASGQTRALDACTLVTAAEASTILGVTLQSNTVPEGSASRCVYFTAADGPSTTFAAININPAGKTTYDSVKQSLQSSGGIQNVTGVGDDAYWSGEDLSVLKGDTILTVTVDGDAQRTFQLNDPQKLSVEKQLAEQAIAHL